MIFFWGFKIRTPYLGVTNSSNSVFKSFFIYNPRTPKYPKKSKKFEKFEKIRKKSRDFFSGIKIRKTYLAMNNSSISVFKSFFYL